MTPFKLSALAPYLPNFIQVVAGMCVGFMLGFFFHSWLKRTQPSQGQLVARVAVAGLLLPLYAVSVVAGMLDHSYSTPMIFHGICGSIILSLFPKQFVRVGQNGVELGFTAPHDKEKRDDHDDDDRPSDEAPSS